MEDPLSQRRGVPPRWLFIACLAMLGGCTGRDLLDGMQQRMDIATKDKSHTLEVGWSLTNGTMRMGVRATNIPYWIGIGISDSLGTMAGADIWAYKMEGGEWKMVDYYAFGNTQPVLDDQQDLQLIESERVQTGNELLVQFVFTRKVDTCDGRDWPISSSHAQSLIWAYGVSDDFGYHLRNRGHPWVFFDKAAKPVNTPVKNLQTWDIVMPNVTLPPNETIYRCTVAKFPKNGTYHVTESSFTGNAGGEESKGESMMHHVIIYQCDKSVLLASKIPVGQAGECDSIRRTCIRSYIGLVPDTVWNSPPKTGLLLGDCPDCATYFAYEIHYHNPQKLAGTWDSSTTHVRYTPQLLDNNASVAVFGAHADESAISLQPKSVETRTYVCPAEATKDKDSGISDSGAYITQIINHMHFHGRNLSAVVVREGKVVYELSPVDYYNFDTQNYVAFGKPYPKIFPGDEVRVTCTWDTKDTNYVTHGGAGSNDEMCFVFLLIYPAPALSWCSSVNATTGHNASGYSVYLSSPPKAKNFNYVVEDVVPLPEKCQSGTGPITPTDIGIVHLSPDSASMAFPGTTFAFAMTLLALLMVG